MCSINKLNSSVQLGPYRNVGCIFCFTCRVSTEFHFQHQAESLLLFDKSLFIYFYWKSLLSAGLPSSFQTYMAVEKFVIYWTNITRETLICRPDAWQVGGSTTSGSRPSNLTIFIMSFVPFVSHSLGLCVKSSLLCMTDHYCIRCQNIFQHLYFVSVWNEHKSIVFA